jgi:hypothetical protein
MGPTVGSYVFPAQVNTVTAEKLHACTAALVILNFRPLERVGCIIYIEHSSFKG